MKKTDKAFRRRRRLLNRIKRLYLKETGRKIDRSQKVWFSLLDSIKHEKDQRIICKELRDLKMTDQMIIERVVEFDRYYRYLCDAKSLEAVKYVDALNDVKEASFNINLTGAHVYLKPENIILDIDI